MTVLVDWAIENRIKVGDLQIDPFRKEQLQAASYDFRLSGKYAIIRGERDQPFSFFYPNDLHVEEFETSDLKLAPNDFVWAISEEFFGFPKDVCGKVYAKSTLGRLGLAVSNGDACWFDPNFQGFAVLELKNNGPLTLTLPSGLKVAQMVFMTTTGQPDAIYNGNYQQQQGFVVDRFVKSVGKLGRDAAEWFADKYLPIKRIVEKSKEVECVPHG